MEQIKAKLIPDDMHIEKPKGFSLEQKFIDDFNAQEKKSDIYNCSKCKNKGLIAFLNEDGQPTFKKCTCFNSRRNRQRLSDLGLLTFIDRTYANDDDSIQEDWLNFTKIKTKEFVRDFKNNKNYWLFVGGKIGSGKTSRCVFALAKMMKAKPELTIDYFNWDTRYKELIFDKDKDTIIENLKYADILYIDDFFRIRKTTELTAMERDAAKMIIDYRYINQKITLISSELFISEITLLDEAIGSRIYQMTGKGKYNIEIKRDEAKNLRLLKGESE